MDSISSNDVAKVIKRVLYPALKEDGFTKIKGRNIFRFHENLVLCFNTRAVGSYFADVTGYTPMSFTATVWVNYHAIPARNAPTFDKNDGIALPSVMHKLLQLTTANLNLQQRNGVHNPAEIERADIWWIDPQGKNIEEMAYDLLTSYKQQVPQWCSVYTDINRALDEVSKERDCFNKSEFIYCLAKSIGNNLYIDQYQSSYFGNMPKYVRELLEKK